MKIFYIFLMPRNRFDIYYMVWYNILWKNGVMTLSIIKKMMKIRTRILIVILCIVAVIILAGILVPNTKLSGKHYDDLESFLADGGTFNSEDEPPQTVQDNFYLRKTLGVRIALRSYYVPEEMFEEYLAKEIAKHSQSKWAGRHAEDCCDPEYELDDFPMDLPFDEIIDDYIGDYTVIAYSPKNTGSTANGLLFNDVTHRFVYFNFRSM